MANPSMFEQLQQQAEQLARQASELANAAQVMEVQQQMAQGPDAVVMMLTIFVLACFVGYYVVWRVTPALHTPLMAVTNAISGIIVVGAMVATGVEHGGVSKLLGFLAVVLASVNIFGGFLVTQRMLEMYKKKEPKAATKGGAQ